jgi:hypothetical protein
VVSVEVSLAKGYNKAAPGNRLSHSENHHWLQNASAKIGPSAPTPTSEYSQSHISEDFKTSGHIPTVLRYFIELIYIVYLPLKVLSIYVN